MHAPKKRWPLVCGIVLLLLAGLWTLGWFGASMLAAGELDAWLAREAVAGRQWSCPDRAVGGYPFAIEVRCTRPTFRGEVAGHTADGVTEGLTAGIGLLHAGTVAVVLKGPLNLRADDDTFEAVLSWESLAVDLPVLGPPTGSLAAGRLAITVAAAGEGVFNMRAAKASGNARAQGADAPFAFAAQGVTFPTMDPIAGLAGPFEVSGEGTLVAAALLTAPTVAHFEAWRDVGGRLDLAALSVAAPPFSGTARGSLALDEAHRPAGRIEASVKGFEPIAKRLGIPEAGVQLGGLLANLLTRGKAPAAEKGVVPLPLVLADGRLAIGPFTTGISLAPLY